MSTKITCPTCGTDSYLEELSREAEAFCRVCDYPLFWSRGERVLGGGEGGSVGLRRLPGTAGRVDVATINCPECNEPNPVVRNICIRCGSELRPPPPAPPPPPPPPAPVIRAPEPEPVVVPERSWTWLWVVLGVAAAVAIVLLVVLLAG